MKGYGSGAGSGTLIITKINPDPESYKCERCFIAKFIKVTEHKIRRIT
jgi:hypothetical protein